MASLNKQQKRAKRAKAKAKQIRMVGRKPLAQDDDLGHLAEPIPEYTLAMFSKMRDAEAVSRNEMLLTLLRELAFIIVDHPELLDMENAENADRLPHVGRRHGSRDRPGLAERTGVHQRFRDCAGHLRSVGGNAGREERINRSQ